MEKVSIRFEDIALKNRLMQEIQARDCIDELLTRGKDKYTPQEFAEVALRKGYLSESEINTIIKAIERLQRDIEKDPQLLYTTMYIPGYVILDRIGDGAMGAVYKARQISMKRVVALKVLHNKWLKDEEFKRRFLIEARAAGKLSHQNLIQVYDVGKFSDRYYFSMEYIDGQTVQDVIDVDGRVDLYLTLDIGLQINRALNFISQYNLVHRDIKPANIMLTSSTGLVKVGDFGFIFAAEEKKIAQEGMTLGTPDYISPEQAKGDPNINVSSDLYSLGATMFHMLSGNTVFTGTSSEVMYQHVDAELPDLKKYLLGIPDEVVTLISKMMAKNPHDRYTCDELFEELEYMKATLQGKGHPGKVAGGKTTLFNAVNVGQLKITRLERQNKKLQRMEHTLKVFLYIVGGITVLLLLMILILLLKM